MNGSDTDGTDPEPERDLSRVSASGQELSSFNSAFDELVRENVARSQALLRQAMDLPAAADRAVQRARAEMQGQLDDERARQAALIAEVRAELAAGQSEVTALVAGLASVVSRFTAISTRLASQDHAKVDSLSEPEPAAVTSLSVSQPEGESAESTATTSNVFASDNLTAPESEFDARVGVSPEDESEAGSEYLGEHDSAEPVGEAEYDRTLTLHISGVRRLPLVIQLQRHLAAFPEIERVRLRDFVSGVVRFEITTVRPVAAADVTTWCHDDATPLEVVTIGAHEIELRLLDVVGSRQ